MSTDWSKYSTPEETQQRARDPELNGVIEMNVGNVREIPPLEVKHTPAPDNRAHTDVCNVPTKKSSKTKVRVKLARISSWIIPIET